MKDTHQDFPVVSAEHGLAWNRSNVGALLASNLLLYYDEVSLDQIYYFLLFSAIIFFLPPVAHAPSLAASGLSAASDFLIRFP